jgi:hypothetical protein
MTATTIAHTAFIAAGQLRREGIGQRSAVGAVRLHADERASSAEANVGRRVSSQLMVPAQYRMPVST